MTFSNETCAFSFERALISFYGRDKLCNLTDGGEGSSGAVRTSYHKDKYSASKIGHKNPMHGKHHTPETKVKMSTSRIGKKPSLGMHHTSEFKEKLSKRMSGNSNPKADNNVYKFYHSVYGIVYATQYQMRSKYGLSSHVSGLVRGFHKSVKGWRLVHNNDKTYP
jgi:hypothetical protein